MRTEAVSKCGLSDSFKSEFQYGQSVQDCSAAGGMVGKRKQTILHALTEVLAGARCFLAFCRGPVDAEAYLGDLAAFGQVTPLGKGGKAVLGKAIGSHCRLVKGSMEKSGLPCVPCLALHFGGPRTSCH